MKKIRLLMVCMGNICRSPMAHGVMAERLREAGLDDVVEVDSAGTHGYHVGEPPDRRAQAAARARGYELGALRARQLVRQDFLDFDYILVMDEDNLYNARAQQPPDSKARLHRFLEFAGSRTEQEVLHRFLSSPVRARSKRYPYYGGADGFTQVMDMVEDAAKGFVAHLREQHGL
jgi:protein-tyrosine phosphatase